MGRKTYESIGKALPGRTNIVLSRNPAFGKPSAGKSEFNPSDAVTVPSLKEALDLTRDAGEVFVIGGQSLYEQALPLADKIYLTVVDLETEGDAFFPKFAAKGEPRPDGRDEGEWTITAKEAHKKDEKNPFDYTYLIYERKKQ